MKIVSWNVNGIRAAVKKEFESSINKLSPDVFCLQETKAQEDEVLLALDPFNDWNCVVNSAEKKGYSGTAIFSKIPFLSYSKGIGVEEHDNEGRVTTAEFENFILINVYTPNSGRGLVRLDYRSEWDIAFAKYLNTLQAKKPIVVCGDLNVAHQEIDLARPKSNYNKTAGYTQIEIDGFQALLDQKLVDSFRHTYTEKIEYTYWNYMFNSRSRNVGWRIDYFLVSNPILEVLNKVEHYTEVLGSDHCPLGLTIMD